MIKEPWFQQIFGMKFLDLFLYYYNNEQPLREMTLFGRKIIFKTTKSFNALLQKNKEIGDKMIKFTKVTYFDDTYSLETERRNILSFNHYIFIIKVKYLLCLIGLISNCVNNFN